jgi:hypothetical protein
MLSGETVAEQMIAVAPSIPPLQDDRPVNEYFLLRAPWVYRAVALRQQH